MEKPRDERILFVFRHGETDWNREGRLQGHTDTRLNATGLAQAEALAESLRAHRPDAVVSSDLARAQTLEVSPGGATDINLKLESKAAGHKNKAGQALAFIHGVFVAQAKLDHLPDKHQEKE